MDKILETLNEILDILKRNGSLTDKAKAVLGAVVKNKLLMIVLIALIALLFIINASSGTPSNGEKMINIDEIELVGFGLDKGEPKVYPTNFAGYSNDHRHWLQMKSFTESFELVPGPVKFSWEKLDSNAAIPQVRSFVTLRIKLNKRLVFADADYLKKYKVNDIVDPATIAIDLFKCLELSVIDTNGDCIQWMSNLRPTNLVFAENGAISRKENLDLAYDFIHFLATAEIGDEYDWVICTGQQLLNSSDLNAHLPGIEEILAQVAGVRISCNGFRINGLDYEGENIWNYDEEEAEIEQRKKDIQAQEEAEQNRKIRSFLRGKTQKVII